MPRPLLATLLLVLPLLARAQGLSLSCDDGRGGNVTATWLHPQPQGNAIGDVDFLDGKLGWAVGDLGTMLRTTDGGESWSLLPSGIRADMASVSLASASVAWISGREILRHTEDGGMTWISHDCPQRYERRLNVPVAVEALSANEVVLLASDAVWRSGDRGESWVLVHDLYMARDLFFLDARHGWALGENGRVLRTTDGGRSWDEHWIVQQGLQYRLHFADSLRGVGLGLRQLHFTMDGGRTWSTASTEDEAFAAAMGQDGRCIIATARGLLASRDRGGSWEQLLELPLADIRALAFANPATGVAFGAHGLMLRTTNGGLSWKKTGSEIPRRLSALSFVSSDRGWAAGYEGVFHTMDGGAHWHRQYDPGRARISDLHFLDEQRGWAVDDHSHALSTVDGGVHWTMTELDAPGHGILTCASFLDTHHGWIAAEQGVLFSTDDGGERWTLQDLPVTGDIAQIAFRHTQHGMCLTWSGEGAATTDGGANWRSWSFGKDYQPVGLALPDDSIVVVLATINREKTVVLRSADAGHTWQSRTIAESGAIGAALRFTGREHGMLFLTDGTAFSTADAGRSWQPLPTPFGFPVRDIAIPQPGRIFVAGHDGSILRVDWDSGELQ